MLAATGARGHGIGRSRGCSRGWRSRHRRGQSEQSDRPAVIARRVARRRGSSRARRRITGGGRSVHRRAAVRRQRRPRLATCHLVLRSFGKTYGLAGLRLGFAIGEPAIISRIRGEIGPWAVSGAAIEIGSAALSDDAWLHAARERLDKELQRLDRILISAGCSIVGGTPLFRLAEHDHAVRIAERLGGQGIHVRSFSRSPGWLRFGLPGAETDWQRLECTLAQ